MHAEHKNGQIVNFERVLRGSRKLVFGFLINVLHIVGVEAFERCCQQSTVVTHVEYCFCALYLKHRWKVPGGADIMPRLSICKNTMQWSKPVNGHDSVMDGVIAMVANRVIVLHSHDGSKR